MLVQNVALWKFPPRIMEKFLGSCRGRYMEACRETVARRAYFVSDLGEVEDISRGKIRKLTTMVDLLNEVVVRERSSSLGFA